VNLATEGGDVGKENNSYFFITKKFYSRSNKKIARRDNGKNGTLHRLTERETDKQTGW
jgi:hypothetical protein